MRRFILLFPLVVSLAKAQAPVKDAGIATTLGMVLPGLGYYYTERPALGIITELGIAGIVTVGQLASTKKADPIPGFYIGSTYYEGYPGVKANYAPLYVSMVLAGAVWVYTAVDAGNEARKFNAKHRVTLVPAKGGIAVSVRLR